MHTEGPLFSNEWHQERASLSLATIGFKMGNGGTGLALVEAKKGSSMAYKSVYEIVEEG